MSIIDNRKAFHDYFIEEQLEAGLVLEGWEVKAIRAGRVQLKESYVIYRNGAFYLFGCHITPLQSASTHIKPDPVRDRKLLLKTRADQPPDRQGGTRRLHHGGAEPALQQRQYQGPTSAWPKARSSTTSAKPKKSANGSAKNSA